MSASKLSPFETSEDCTRMSLPEARKAAGRLKVSVDLNRCQGYAQCCYAAPAHFEIEGHEALFYDPAPQEAARADIERARIACPVQAIRVEDAGGGAV